jgi:hypothetical protein
VLLVGPAAANVADPDDVGVNEKTTSGFPEVDPQPKGVWFASRPENVNVRVPPLADTTVGELQLSPPVGGGASGTQLPLEQV